MPTSPRNVRARTQAKPNRLRWLRENRCHLTLGEVATLTGYDITTISRQETFDRPLTPGAIEKYARLYKVSSWEIFHDPAEMPATEAEADQPESPDHNWTIPPLEPVTFEQSSGGLAVVMPPQFRQVKPSH